MPFVVKLTSRASGISWLSAANDGGVRTLAGRESADVGGRWRAARVIPVTPKANSRRKGRLDPSAAVNNRY
jgi:hypothetical protein